MHGRRGRCGCAVFSAPVSHLSRAVSQALAVHVALCVCVYILLAVMSTVGQTPTNHGTWQSGVTGFDPRLAKPPDRKRSRGSILFSVLDGARRGADEVCRAAPTAPTTAPPTALVPASASAARLHT